MSELRALTVRQPWAHMIVHCGKDVENRSWHPPAGLHEVAIHAGARSGWDRSAEDDWRVRAAWLRYAAALPPMNAAAVPIRRDALHIDFAAIIAVAEITGWHPASECDHICPEPGDWDGNVLPCTDHDGECNNLCSPWAVDDQFHWWLVVRPLAEPVPCKGALGLWRVPDDIESAVRAQLEATHA